MRLRFSWLVGGFSGLIMRAACKTRQVHGSVVSGVGHPIEVAAEQLFAICSNLDNPLLFG